MSTVISHVSKLAVNDNLVLLGNKDSRFEGYNLSKPQLDFIKSQVKIDKKYITINDYKRIVFIQIIDEKKEAYQTVELCRKAGERLLADINQNKIKSVTLVTLSGNSSFILGLAEGMVLGNYQFLKYFRKDISKEKHTLQNVRIFSKTIDPQAIKYLQIITDSTLRARNLVNEPASHLSAQQLADEMKNLGKEAGFKVNVLQKAKIKSLKMGGLLAVNAGSKKPPTFTIMEWNPPKKVNKKPYVLVGKGVVFDTGGLSIKPTTNSMDQMKSDMAGAAAVSCTMYAVAKAKLPVHIISLVPATDNRPGEDAYAPGDVIEMHNGLTVEVLNTDAEGRMILGDALSYARKYKPELVFDVATLTGSANAAIGSYGIVCMGTAPESVKAELKKSGNETFERLVEFPFWDEYDELIKSDIADMKNIGGPTAGAITAGKFLEKFTDYPWIHFDIAGPAFLKTNDSYRGKNATGVSVRLLFNFFHRIAKHDNPVRKG